ncbi:MAG: hypothetical protein CMN87_17605 [Stappia sp.]|uniref:hypothetical protein n=1 Tax=Stappia sp. TaxID=1870903 RepID=UPI000C617820|nr:hypothetical protein [Stappia sp.]MAA96704.1 hypothetical protein [Stappia sp.]MBM21822.1 hypothetical protein [Stappia sp.]|tara:strand:- start:167 stop:505 length:339 start_codon:yes stop_codon:yes gene_type:complete
MMTIHKIYQPSAPALIWAGSIAAFAAVLGLGVATFGDAADAQADRISNIPIATHAVATEGEAGAQQASACDGVIFRDEDPQCFATTPGGDSGPHPRNRLGTLLPPQPGSAGS